MFVDNILLFYDSSFCWIFCFYDKLKLTCLLTYFYMWLKSFSNIWFSAERYHQKQLLLVWEQKNKVICQGFS